MWCVIFFNDTATAEIYTLSLHDALPIWRRGERAGEVRRPGYGVAGRAGFQGQARGSGGQQPRPARSEEHTSELQSRQYLVCRLLLEKKNSVDRQSTPLHTPPSSIQARAH